MLIADFNYDCHNHISLFNFILEIDINFKDVSSATEDTLLGSEVQATLTDIALPDHMTENPILPKQSNPDLPLHIMLLRNN